MIPNVRDNRDYQVPYHSQKRKDRAKILHAECSNVFQPKEKRKISPRIRKCPPEGPAGLALALAYALLELVPRTVQSGHVLAVKAGRMKKSNSNGARIEKVVQRCQTRSQIPHILEHPTNPHNVRNPSSLMRARFAAPKMRNRYQRNSKHQRCYREEEAQDNRDHVSTGAPSRQWQTRKTRVLEEELNIATLAFHRRRHGRGESTEQLLEDVGQRLLRHGVYSGQRMPCGYVFWRLTITLRGLLFFASIVQSVSQTVLRGCC